MNQQTVNQCPARPLTAVERDGPRDPCNFFPRTHPLPEAPTSEDVDSELSRPRLFFPGGLLLVLTESLLPAEGGTGLEREPILTAQQRPSRPPHLGEAGHRVQGPGHCLQEWQQARRGRAQRAAR